MKNRLILFFLLCILNSCTTKVYNITYTIRKEYDGKLEIDTIRNPNNKLFITPENYHFNYNMPKYIFPELDNTLLFLSTPIIIRDSNLYLINN